VDELLGTHRVEGGYEHADPTPDSDVLVFIARNPHD
jgi:hypothetical protein